MEQISELQELVNDQLVRHKVSKQRPPIIAKQTKLTFSDASSVGTLGSKSILQANPVSLEYDPYIAYQRSKRVIKHSTDKYIAGTDYPEHLSVDRTVASKKSKGRKQKFPDYTSLNSTNNSAYWKGVASHGRMRKVTLAKLDHLSKSVDSEGVTARSGSIMSVDSLSLPLTSIQSRSVDDLFSTVFSERELTKKQLSDELCFISKIATPRLIKHDPEARFKSKDLLNGLIEDVSSKTALRLCSVKANFV
jgi:hypothetical protein